jgi:hypothetical protein
MSLQCHDTAFQLGTPGTGALLYPQPLRLRIHAEPYCSPTPLGKGLKDKFAFFDVVVER